MPALLFFSRRTWWIGLICLTIVASFILCIAIGMFRTDFAFYLFPTRAWELGLGSLGAFLVGRSATGAITSALFWPSLAALVILPLFPIGGLHPGWDAVLACVATLTIILRAHPFLNGPLVRPLTWVGDISYSLYLVHWPLFVLFNNIWIGGQFPLPIKLALIALAFALAWAQYHFIENPIRQAKVAPAWRPAVLMGCLTLATIGLPYAAIGLGSAPSQYVEDRRGNTGLGSQCVSDRSFTLKPGCSTGAPPTILVWGDSYAMHLVPGLVDTRGGDQIVQATKYVCGPLLDLAPIGHSTGSMQNRYWAQGCLDYNRDVIAYLRQNPTIQTVVLSSVFKQYMTPDEFQAIERTAQGDVEVTGGIEPALAGIGRTIAAVRAMGRKVVVIAPPPALDWDAGLCSERRLRGLTTLGQYASCAIPDDEYRKKRAAVLAFLGEVPRRFGAEVIMFDPWLRVGNSYPTFPAGKIWFIANGHLSYAGSVALARRMDLARLAKAKAH